MDIFLIYLWLKLDTFRAVFEGITWLSALAGGLSLFVWSACHDDQGFPHQGCRKWVKFLAVMFVISVVFTTIIPSTKQAAVIVAGTATYRALSGETATKLGGAFAKFVEAKALELLEPPAKKEK